MTGQWLQRFVKIVAVGVLFAIAVTELELAFGVDLLDAPFFQLSLQGGVLAVVAVAFAAWQARRGTTAGMAAAVLAFGIVVLPFNGLVEPPPTPVDFWRGNAGLFVDRSMTVNRPHPVVLVIRAPQQITKPPGGSADARDALGADTIVARLFGDPRSTFTVVPDKDQAKPLNQVDDLRWTWTATPREQGPQRLVLELDTVVKNRGSTESASNLYRQAIRITVQPPSWYEAGRRRLINLVSGSS